MYANMTACRCCASASATCASCSHGHCMRCHMECSRRGDKNRPSNAHACVRQSVGRASSAPSAPLWCSSVLLQPRKLECCPCNHRVAHAVCPWCAIGSRSRMMRTHLGAHAREHAGTHGGMRAPDARQIPPRKFVMAWTWRGMCRRKGLLCTRWWGRV
jgi:hypothetical protein